VRNRVDAHEVAEIAVDDHEREAAHDASADTEISRQPR
jgi:hypothetical protein